METVLHESGNKWMLPSEIASGVNRRGRYRRRDRKPVPASQVTARAIKYQEIFECRRWLAASTQLASQSACASRDASDDERSRAHGTGISELAQVPPATEWFANIDNPNTRRAYRNDLKEFMSFVGVSAPDELRLVTRAIATPRMQRRQP